MFTSQILDSILQSMADAGRLLASHDVTLLTIATKDDGTPVCQADRQSDIYLREKLSAIAPSIPVVSEENLDSHVQAGIGDYFLLDGLDGTREYLTGLDQYTINVALVHDAQVTFGAICAPAREQLFWTTRDGRAMLRDRQGTRDIRARAPRRQDMVAVTSRSGPDPNLLNLAPRPITRTIGIGSALKFCYIACGEADIYVRTKTSYEWDTAAGAALIEAAGGSVLSLSGQPLSFGSKSMTHGGFVATGISQ